MGARRMPGFCSTGNFRPGTRSKLSNTYPECTFGRPRPRPSPARAGEGEKSAGGDLSDRVDDTVDDFFDEVGVVAFAGDANDRFGA